MQRAIPIIGILLVLILSGIPTILSFDSYCINQIENNNEVDWWLMFHHDIGHSGYSTSATPETYNIKWISSYGSAYSSPAVANGKVFKGKHNGIVYCLNADTGMKIWEFTSEDSISIFPTVADGKLYISSDYFKLYCLDSDTGEKMVSERRLPDLNR